MKQFNKVITVEVSVDSIAQQLLSTFSSDFKHAELVAETIIATGLEKGTLTYLYNSLNGFSSDINFQVGDEVLCTDSTYDFSLNASGAYEESHKPIGACKIVEINPYSTTKVNIEFMKTKRDGTQYKQTKWISHSSCDYMAIVL